MPREGQDPPHGERQGRAVGLFAGIHAEGGTHGGAAAMKIVFEIEFNNHGTFDVIVNGQNYGSESSLDAVIQVIKEELKYYKEAPAGG
jgi:hypothetical protein